MNEKTGMIEKVAKEIFEKMRNESLVDSQTGKNFVKHTFSGNIINLANVLAEICGKASFNLVNLNIKRISDTRITIYFENKEWLYHRTNTFSLQKSNNVGVCFKV